MTNSNNKEEVKVKPVRAWAIINSETNDLLRTPLCRTRENAIDLRIDGESIIEIEIRPVSSTADASEVEKKNKKVYTEPEDPWKALERHQGYVTDLTAQRNTLETEVYKLRKENEDLRVAKSHREALLEEANSLEATLFVMMREELQVECEKNEQLKSTITSLHDSLLEEGKRGDKLEEVIEKAELELKLSLRELEQPDIKCNHLFVIGRIREALAEIRKKGEAK